MPTKTSDPISRHIFELRFKPNSKVLDFRGEWTNYLSTEMNLPEWKIDINRIDLYDTNDLAFLSYKNCGFVSQLPPTKNYFEDQATKFLRAIFLIEGFKPLPVTRLGVRSTFIKSYSGEFTSLFEKYKEKVINPTSEVLKIFGTQLVDIGAPLNFKDNDSYFNTMSGPMALNQIKQFFPTIENIPNVGLFFEIDYFKEEIGDVSVEYLTGLIKTYAQKSWQKMEGLTQLLFT